MLATLALRTLLLTAVCLFETSLGDANDTSNAAAVNSTTPKREIAAVTKPKLFPNQAFEDFENELRMPKRYPIVPVNSQDLFFIETGANKEFPIWHAHYPTAGALWPQPKHESRTEQLFRLDPVDFAFVLSGKLNDILIEAVARYRDIILEQKAVGVLFEAPSEQEKIKLLRTVKVHVEKDGGKYPHLEMDESYKIFISADGHANISATETWGALRAFETFVQLVLRSPPSSADDALFVSVTAIDDAPRFRYRGLMVDTARHFISKHTLLRNLEAMAINKLNVFHWHIVDDSSFPFESRAWPDLSKRGAYDAERMIYTHADVREIVEFARLRGIRVVPEFDIPSHTHAWGRGYPQLLTPCYQQGGGGGSAKSVKVDDTNYEFDGHFGPMNPSKNFTFYFLERLFDEVAALFPDEYLHIGGDESGKTCWMSNPRVRAMPEAADGGHTLYKYFMWRMYEIVKKVGKLRDRNMKSQVWHEALQDQFNNIVQPGSTQNFVAPKDTIVQMWRKELSARKVVDMGFDTIYSACWYLDAQKEGVNTQWVGYYRCDATFDDAVASNSPHFLGGEACMWGEWQSDQSILTRIWPLASTAAERLWSHIGVDAVTAAPRLEALRCLMTARGIPVAVASGAGACAHFTDRHDLLKQVAAVPAPTRPTRPLGPMQPLEPVQPLEPMQSPGPTRPSVEIARKRPLLPVEKTGGQRAFLLLLAALCFFIVVAGLSLKFSEQLSIRKFYHLLMLWSRHIYRALILVTLLLLLYYAYSMQKNSKSSTESTDSSSVATV